MFFPVAPAIGENPIDDLGVFSVSTMVEFQLF